MLPSSKRELGRGKKKKKKTALSPKSENISWISWMCVFLGKRKQYENRNFFPVLTSIGLSGTSISLLMIASLFHPFFSFFWYMNLHYLARNLLLSRTGCIFHLANFWKSSLPSLCPYLIAFLHFSLVTHKSNYSILEVIIFFQVTKTLAMSVPKQPSAEKKQSSLIHLGFNGNHNWEENARDHYTAL